MGLFFLGKSGHFTAVGHATVRLYKAPMSVAGRLLPSLRNGRPDLSPRSPGIPVLWSPNINERGLYSILPRNAKRICGTKCLSPLRCVLGLVSFGRACNKGIPPLRDLMAAHVESVEGLTETCDAGRDLASEGLWCTVKYSGAMKDLEFHGRNVRK